MACLCLPLLLGILILACIGAFIRKHWRIGSVLFLLSLIINYYGQIIAFHLFAKEKGSQFKVLTHNVNSSGRVFDNSWDSILNLILFENPDFVYLTELGYKGESIHNHLISKYPFSNEPNNQYDDHLEHFYSKWPIDTIELLTLPHGFHSIHRVQISLPSDTLSLYCCHLSSNLFLKTNSIISGIRDGYKHRSSEANLLFYLLSNDSYPAILLGDLNDISGSYTLNRIEAAGMRDAWWKGGLGYGATYHGYGLRLRLDHILYDDTNLILTGVKTIKGRLSDHNAITATFCFKGISGKQD